MTGSTTRNDSMRRLHPVSLVFEFASILRANVIPTVAAIVSSSRGGWIGAAIGAAVFGIGITIAIIRFVTFRYRMTSDELIVDSGLIHRVHRTIPTDKIQNIDLSQNVFHRILRVGEVRIETASGKEPEAVMRVIAIQEYLRLRSELFSYRNLELAQLPETGLNVQSSSDTKTESPELVLALSTKLVILAGLLSNRGEVVAGLVVGFLWQQLSGNSWWGSAGSWDKESVREVGKWKAMPELVRWVRGTLEYLGTQTGPFGVAVIVLVGLFVLVSVLRTFSAIWYLLRFYGYRLERVGDSLHVRCGLFTKVSATIPFGRIQFISVQQKWLIRQFGLASIRIETAGGGEKEAEDAPSSIGRNWFVPIVNHAEVARILAVLDSRLEGLEGQVDWIPTSSGTRARMFRSVLLAVFAFSFAICFWSFVLGVSTGILLLALGWLYVVKKAKSRRYGRTKWGLVYRSGTWERKYSMTFFEKLQSATVNQSPFDRRWNMATLKVDTAAAGPAKHRIEVQNLNADQAIHELRAIVSSQNEIALTCRDV